MGFLQFYLSKLVGEQARSPKAGTFLGWFVQKVMEKQNVNIAHKSLELLDPKPESVIVELGSGNGHVLEQLFQAKNPSRVYAIEISDAFRALLNEKFENEVKPPEGKTTGRLTIHADDAKSMPSIEDSSVDYLYAMNVIYFLDPLPEYMTEMYRILKPGGTMIWGVDSRAEENDPTHFKNTDWDKCIEAMKDAKFSDVKKDETFKAESITFLTATK